MARTRFEVRFNGGEHGEDAWGEHGIDQAEFFVSPNVGEDLRPLARIVSGGELSRMMLALKTMAVADGAGKTLIFDEVDAGIGGEVAEVVGAEAAAAGEALSGDLHHAPPADRFASEHPLQHREVGSGASDGDGGSTIGRSWSY